MKPIRSITVIQWQARSKTIKLPGEYGSQEAPRFCKDCGREIVIELSQTTTYNRQTGKRMLDTYAVCPARPDGLLGRLSMHTREWVLLSQADAYDLLYEGTLEALLPNQ